MFREESLIVGIPFVPLAPRMQIAVAATPKVIKELNDFLSQNSDEKSDRSEKYFFEFRKLCSGFLKSGDLHIERDIKHSGSQLSLIPQNVLSRLRILNPKENPETEKSVSVFLSRKSSTIKREDLLLNGSMSPIVLSPDVPSKDLDVLEEIFKLESFICLEAMQWLNPHIPWLACDERTHLDFIKEHGATEFYELTQKAICDANQKFLSKKRLLLHVCCGPDAGGVIEQLKDEYELTCFWYDPNIQPRSEHDKRLETFLKVCEIEKVPVIVGEYDVENFYDRIEGLEHTPEKGAKCSHCYDMRLERSAIEARNGEFDLYSTTLAISPHKVQEKLKAFGKLNEKKYGVPYLAKNFLKADGFKDSVAYTKEHQIYRQDYCGCYFSLAEGGPQAQESAKQLGLPLQTENPFRGVDQETPYLGLLSVHSLSQLANKEHLI